MQNNNITNNRRTFYILSPRHVHHLHCMPAGRWWLGWLGCVEAHYILKCEAFPIAYLRLICIVIPNNYIINIIQL